MDRGNKQTERARPTERAGLEEAIRRARARVASAPAGSPDWDAAMAAVEELDSRLATATSR